MELLSNRSQKFRCLQEQRSSDCLIGCNDAHAVDIDPNGSDAITKREMESLLGYICGKPRSVNLVL